MKLFVILENQKDIVAISEEEEDVARFIIARNLKYTYIRVKGKVAEQIAIQYDDVYLEHDPKLDVVATRIEHKVLQEVIQSEKYRIMNTSEDLRHYISDYKLDKKSKSTLKKALAIMESMEKTKRLRKVIEIENFVGFLNRSKHVFELFTNKVMETADKMYILFDSGED